MSQLESLAESALKETAVLILLSLLNNEFCDSKLQYVRRPADPAIKIPFEGKLISLPSDFSKEKAKKDKGGYFCVVRRR